MKDVAIRLLKWISIALIALVVMYIAFLLHSSIQLRRAYAALEADGRPMKAEDIIPGEVAVADNAAPLLEDAVSRLKENSVGEKDLLSYTVDAVRDLPTDWAVSEKDDELHDLFQNDTIAQALTLIDQAVEKPACRFDVEWDKGMAVLLPHIMHIRNVTRLLSAKARFEAEMGDGQQSWETVQTGLRISDFLREEPVLISQLVRIAQFSTMVEAIQEISPKTTLSESQFKTLDSLLDQFDNVQPLVRAMDGERLLLGEWAFNLPRAEFKENISFATDISSAILAFVPRSAFQADHAAYLRVMHKYTRAMEDASDHLDSNALDDIESEIPWYCLITRLVTPAFSGVFKAKARFLAQVRVTRAGLALRFHKQHHGAYPADLSKLIPPLPDEALMDPFTGKPLLYRVEGNGFVLYSVGDNRKDDGGSSEQEDDRPLDYAWRVSN